MPETHPIVMIVGLLGGLALFLYGMEKMTDGLKAAAGQQMSILLRKLTRNRVMGAVTGIVVTAVIQSSSVTTVLVVGFVSAGLMTLAQSVGVIFGANVGTTVTAQIVAFNATALAAPLIAVGFTMTFIWRQGGARHYGTMLLGLGMIFLGMDAMGTAMSPLRTNESFIDLMGSMQTPLLGILIGAVFTALVQSSSATISLTVVLATQGLIPLPAGIAIVFGAKIGTCATALLASIGKPTDARRAASVHIMYNIAGAGVWLPFIPLLAQVATAVSPTAPELDGVDKLAAEVPRQIANAATIWATANMLIFLPFSTVFARLATRLVPDRRAEEEALVEPRFLDDEVVKVPSMALERVRLELGHMAEIVESMLGQIGEAFRNGESDALKREHQKVVLLRDAILGYLQRVGREELSNAESAEHARLVYATADIENLSGVVGLELAPLAEEIRKAAFTPSEETVEMFRRLLELTQASAADALDAIVQKDVEAARRVFRVREGWSQLGGELHRQQAERLLLDDPHRLMRHRIQVSVMEKLRRVQDASEHAAQTVLPSELAESGSSSEPDLKG